MALTDLSSVCFEQIILSNSVMNFFEFNSNFERSAIIMAQINNLLDIQIQK